MLQTIRRYISKFTALIILFSLAVPFIIPAYGADTGAINISTSHVNGSYTIYKVSDNSVVDTGSGILSKKFIIEASATGIGYSVVFGSVTGYTTPLTYYFSLVTGEDWTIGPNEISLYQAGLYFPLSVSTGAVSISTSHVNGVYTINKKSDGSYVDTGSGILPKKFILEASTTGIDYTVMFGAVTGYTNPSSFDFTLKTGDNLTYGPNESGLYQAGIYVPVSGTTTGTITISTSHVSGSYTIYKVSDNSVVDTGSGILPKKFILEASATGIGYSVVFGSVTGYTTPLTYYFNLIAGEDWIIGPNEISLYQAGLYFPINTQFADPAVTSKTASSSTPAPGATVTYTVNYGNLGSVDAMAVTIMDDYDENYLTISNISDTNCYDSKSTITCSFSTLQANSTGSFTYDALIINTAAIGTVINNTASIIASSSNSDTSNDSASAQITLSSTPTITGQLVITLKDDLGASFSGSGDFNIYRDGSLFVTGQPTDFNQTGMAAGKYTLLVNSVTVGGTAYTGVATLKSSSDTITNQGDKVEYEVVYTASSSAITGQLTVTLEDGAGGKFSVTSGDFDILKDSFVYVSGQPTDFDQTGMDAAKYTLAARSITVGSDVYKPTITLESTSDTITNQGDKVEYRIDYVKAAVTGQVDVKVYEGSSGSTAFTDGNYSILLDGNIMYTFEQADFSKTGMPDGKYTISASSVTVSGTTYNPTVTLKSTSDTITVQGDKVEYEIRYIASSSTVTGQVVVTLKDNLGASFSGSGDFNIYRDGSLFVTGQPTDFNQTGMSAGKYTILVNSVTVGGKTYNGTSTLKSTSDTITNQGDKVEYEVVYTASSGTVTGQVVVTLKDNLGASFSGSGDFDILKDSSLYVSGQSTDFDTTGLDTGKYTITARSSTVNSKTYYPTVTLKSTIDTITNQGDKVEYEIVYSDVITGQLIVTLEDGASGKFSGSGDYDILLAGKVTSYINQTADFNKTGQAVGKYTLAARPITVGSDVYKPTITLESASDTITNQGDKVEYRIDYVKATATGQVDVKVYEGSSGGTAFTNGDYNVLLDGSLAYISQKADFSKTGMPNGKYTVTASSVIVSGTTYNPTVTLKSASNEIKVNGDKVEYEVIYVKSGSTQNPDLTIESFALSSTSNTPTPGASITYEIKYKNLSTTAGATGVTMDVDYDETDGTVILPTGCKDNTPSTGIMQCTLADLALSGTGTLTFAYTIKSGLAVNTELEQKATIATVSADSDTSNNSATVKTLVGGDFTLTKTVDQSTIGNNILVTYTVKLKRNTSVGSSVSYKLTDSFTGKSSISGSNSGTLTYLPNSGKCTGVTCTGAGTSGGQDIGEAPITVTLDKAGAEATVTYQARSSTSAMSANSTSIITNTTTAADTATTNPLPSLSASANVTLQGPSTPSGSSSSGGGSGGGGGGGGSIVYTGDMKLKVERLISLDGTNYSNATEKDISTAIAENKTTTLYTKIYITNSGLFSANDIKFLYSFDEGKSDIEAGSVTDVKNATLYKNYFTVQKVKVGEKYEFSYKTALTETGSNTNPATESLKLTAYSANLPIYQDGLKYTEIGKIFSTYIYAGTVPASGTTSTGSTSQVMSINVTSDKSSAAPGDIVNFTITAKNLTSGDLTNVFVNHDYDSETFDVASALSAKNDGKGLMWSVSKLSAGSTLTYNFSLKVKSTATIGKLADGLTRVLVSEYENIDPVYNSIRIISAASSAGKQIQLAKTGPAGMLALMMVLSALGYVGMAGLKQNLYLRKRKLALAEI